MHFGPLQMDKLPQPDAFQPGKVSLTWIELLRIHYHPAQGSETDPFTPLLARKDHGRFNSLTFTLGVTVDNQTSVQNDKSYHSVESAKVVKPFEVSEDGSSVCVSFLVLDPEVAHGIPMSWPQDLGVILTKQAESLNDILEGQVECQVCQEGPPPLAVQRTHLAQHTVCLSSSCLRLAQLLQSGPFICPLRIVSQR